MHTAIETTKHNYILVKETSPDQVAAILSNDGLTPIKTGRGEETVWVNPSQVVALHPLDNLPEE